MARLFGNPKRHTAGAELGEWFKLSRTLEFSEEEMEVARGAFELYAINGCIGVNDFKAIFSE